MRDRTHAVSIQRNAQPRKPALRSPAHPLNHAIQQRGDHSLAQQLSHHQITSSTSESFQHVAEKRAHVSMHIRVFVHVKFVQQVLQHTLVQPPLHIFFHHKWVVKKKWAKTKYRNRDVVLGGQDFIIASSVAIKQLGADLTREWHPHGCKRKRPVSGLEKQKQKQLQKNCCPQTTDKSKKKKKTQIEKCQKMDT